MGRILIKVKRESGPGRKVLEDMIREASAMEAKLGWDKSAVYPNGTPVAEVAAVQEYGDPAHNIPQRSYMRTTAAERQQEWRDYFYKIAKKILEGGLSVEEGFETFVLKAEGDIVEKITTIQEPPLKEATIQARLNRRKDQLTVGNLTKPLVDTGHMLATFTSTVNGKVVSGSNGTDKG